MSGTSCHPDTPLNMVKPDNLNLYVNVEQESFYKMIPVSSANQAEEVFNLVNYNVTDEIDEGYSTNYSPSSKSTSSSFECESSLERPDTSSEYVTGQIGERIEDEKGNMMWLVDFKLDFLNDIDKNGEKRLQECDIPSPNKRLKLSSGPELCPESPLNLSHPLQSPAQSVSPPVLTQEPFEISSNKPNYTYTDLITLALKDKTSLTVSEIYQWITDNFPYYKAEDDRWKNSVRHNLSMNPNFRKGGRAKQGTGHVWVLADQTAEPLRQEPLAVSSPKDTTDEAIRKILQSSFPKTSEKVPSRKRVSHHARQTRQTPVVAPLLPPPPPPQYPVQVLQPCVETSLSLPVVQYEVGPASHYPPQYVSTDLTAGHGQHHYDFSVSDSDRLVRALGLDFSEPTVQRELSAK